VRRRGGSETHGSRAVVADRTTDRSGEESAKEGRLETLTFDDEGEEGHPLRQVKLKWRESRGGSSGLLRQRKKERKDHVLGTFLAQKAVRAMAKACMGLRG